MKSRKYTAFSVGIASRLVFLIGCFLPLKGCQQSEKDSNGKPHSFSVGPHKKKDLKTARIMALSPALTEQLFFLIPDDQIAAVTHVCNYPEKTDTKKRVTTYPLDVETLLSIRPDYVLTEEGITQPADIARLKKWNIPVIVFRYRTVDDVLDGMDSICRLTPPKPGALKNLADLRDSVKIRREKFRPGTAAPSVLILTWFDPIFAYGYDTWVSDKIRLAGGQNALQKAMDKPYPILPREAVLALQPDLILGKSFSELDKGFFRKFPELKQIPAYRNRLIFPFDDDKMSRPSPRFLESIREIERSIANGTNL